MSYLLHKWHFEVLFQFLGSETILVGLGLYSHWRFEFPCEIPLWIWALITVSVSSMDFSLFKLYILNEAAACFKSGFVFIIGVAITAGQSCNNICSLSLVSVQSCYPPKLWHKTSHSGARGSLQYTSGLDKWFKESASELTQTKPCQRRDMLREE